ncbi:hypothetical protein HDU89_002355 [Geranomyces variabilis]|nr:hypothetical protein HDU89_002355 [Geranomyces variabilis]
MCRVLVAFIPEQDGSNEDSVALERLKTAHDTGCLWARQSMEESAYRFPIISPPKIVHCFHIRYEKLIANPSDVPVSVFLHPIEERLAHLDIPGLANELKLTPHSDAAVTKASVLLALFGWDLVCAGSHRFLECALCARRAGLWNFSKVAPFSSGSADRDPKRIKLTGPQGVSPVLPDFAVWHQHRWYCPWVNNVNFKAGWITTLDAVQPLRLRKKAAPAGASPAQAQPSAAVTSLPPADHVTVNNGAEMSLHPAAGTLPATQGVASASSPPVIHVSDSVTVARPSVRALNIESHKTLPSDVDSMPRSSSVQDASDSPAPSDDGTTRPLSSKPIIVAPSPWPSTPATLATLGGQSGDHGSLSSVPLQQIFEGHRDHSNGTTTGEQGQTPLSSHLSRTELVQLKQPTPRAGADDEMKNSNPDPSAKNQPLADGDRPATEAHMLFAPMHPKRMLEAVANEEAANKERGRPESAAMDWVSSIIQSAPSSPLQGFSEVDVPAARLVAANIPSFSLFNDHDSMDVDAAAFVHPSAPASVDNDVSVVWDGRTRVANERNASDIEEFTHHEVYRDFEVGNQALPAPLATLLGTVNDSHAFEVEDTPEGRFSPFTHDTEVVEQILSSSNGPSLSPEGSPNAEIPVQSEQSVSPHDEQRQLALDDAAPVRLAVVLENTSRVEGPTRFADNNQLRTKSSDKNMEPHEVASLVLVDEESVSSNQQVAVSARDSHHRELAPQLAEPNLNIGTGAETMVSDVDQSIQVSPPDKFDDRPAAETLLPPNEGSEISLCQPTEDTNAMDWEPLGGMEGDSTAVDPEPSAEVEEPVITTSLGEWRAGSNGERSDADAASREAAHEDGSMRSTETAHSVVTGSRMDFDDGANDDGQKENVETYKARQEEALASSGEHADEIELLNKGVNAEPSSDTGHARDSEPNVIGHPRGMGPDPVNSAAVGDMERTTTDTGTETPDDEPIGLMTTEAESEFTGRTAGDISPPIATDEPDYNPTERVPSDSVNVEPQPGSVVVQPSAYSVDFHAHANPHVDALDDHNELLEAEHVTEHDAATHEGDDASGGLQGGSLADVTPHIAAASGMHDGELRSADAHISEINTAAYEEEAEGMGDAESELHEILMISSQDADERSSDLSDEVSALPPSPLEGYSDGSESDEEPYEDEDEDDAGLPHFLPYKGETNGSESDEEHYEDEEECDAEHYSYEYEEQDNKKISGESDVIVIDSDSDDDRDMYKANQAGDFDREEADDDGAYESIENEEAHIEEAPEAKEEYDEEGRELPTYSTERTVEPSVDEDSGQIAEVYDDESDGVK